MVRDVRAALAAAVGRRALRRAHRRGQHHQPVAGPRQRAAEGTGDAQCHRRGARPRCPTAGHRNDCCSPESVAGLACCSATGASTPSHGWACRICRARTRSGWTARCWRSRSGLAALLGVVVGVAPAVQLARASLSNILREDGRTGTAGRGSRYLRRGLVVSQVALAFVLLIGAGLLLTSFQRLLGVEPGLRRRARPDRPGQSAADELSRRRGAAVVHQPGARSDPRAARYRGRRRQQLPAVQLGRAAAA